MYFYFTHLRTLRKARDVYPSYYLRELCLEVVYSFFLLHSPPPSLIFSYMYAFYLVIYSFIHLFIQLVFIEHQLCARHCCRHWGNSSKEHSTSRSINSKERNSDNR